MMPQLLASARRGLWAGVLASAVLLPLRGELPALQSHEINADRSITLRCYAPLAKSVEVSLDYDPQAVSMKKGPDGVWVWRTAPLLPALHMYGFRVDGVGMLDPLNPLVDPGYFYFSNQVWVPGPDPQLWDPGDVPHGVVHHHVYASARIKNLPQGLEDYYVYTPPGYDPTKPTRYPVLYLLHGWSNKANGWVEDGQANFILDHLIAQHLAKPMILVMPLSYGDLDFVTKGMDEWKDPSAVSGNTAKFDQALRLEIMPQVEAQYRTLTNRENRAITGLSMGGGESLTIGLDHPETFGEVGGFSAALPSQDYGAIFPKLGSASQSQPDLLWIACGTGETLLKSNRLFSQWVKARGLKPVQIEIPGIHNWLVWRDNLIHLAPLLFRNAGT